MFFQMSDFWSGSAFLPDGFPVSCGGSFGIRPNEVRYPHFPNGIGSCISVKWMLSSPHFVLGVVGCLTVLFLWVMAGGSGSSCNPRTETPHSPKPSQEAWSFCSGLGSEDAYGQLVSHQSSFSYLTWIVGPACSLSGPLGFCMALDHPSWVISCAWNNLIDIQPSFFFFFLWCCSRHQWHLGFPDGFCYVKLGLRGLVCPKGLMWWQKSHHFKKW